MSEHWIGAAVDRKPAATPSEQGAVCAHRHRSWGAAALCAVRLRLRLDRDGKRLTAMVGSSADDSWEPVE